MAVAETKFSSGRDKSYEELVEELQYPAGTHSLSMWQQRPGYRKQGSLTPFSYRYSFTKITMVRNAKAFDTANQTEKITRVGNSRKDKQTIEVHNK